MLFFSEKPTLLKELIISSLQLSSSNLYHTSIIECHVIIFLYVCFPYYTVSSLRAGVLLCSFSTPSTQHNSCNISGLKYFLFLALLFCLRMRNEVQVLLMCGGKVFSFQS